MRVYPWQRITEDVANLPRLGQISSRMLADTTLLKPERYRKAHVSGTDEKKSQVYGISGEFRRLGKSLPLVPTNPDH